MRGGGIRRWRRRSPHRRRWSREVEVGEVALGVEGRGTTGAGGGDRLAVVVVDQVAAREDTGQVGPGGRRVHEHVALVVETHLTRQQLRARVVADRDEQPGRVELAGLAGLGVAQGDPGDLVVAVDLGDLGVPGELDLRVGEGALLHDLGGAELAAAVDQGDLGAEAGQEGRLLDRGVATTDDGDVLLAEEEAVAGRAPADAVAGEPVLVGQAELAVARAHGQDHGLRGEGALGGGDHLGLAGEVERGHVVGDDLGAEALGLGPHLVHQGRALDAVAEAREVLDLGRVHQGATSGDGPLEQQGREVRAGGVHRCGVARRAGPHDDHVAGLALVGPCLGHCHSSIRRFTPAQQILGTGHSCCGRDATARDACVR